jgi:hypothetical protein
MDEETKLASVPAEPRFSLRQRIALRVVPWLARALLMVLGSTLRFEHSWDGDPPPPGAGHPPPGAVVPFWHGCLLSATYYFRGWNATIMVSNSFDGELIARVLHRFGFRTIRGSSTRGAVRALLGMRKQAAQGAFTIFTADGPKGPRFVAKPGPLLVARNTQQPIYCFYFAPRRAWQLNSWDRLLIPKPFTKVHLRWSKRIEVPAGTSSEGMKTFYGQVQAALEDARLEAERRAKGMED